MAYGRGSKGKHWGSLAGGFMEGLLASLRYGMQADYYKAMEAHWAHIDGLSNGPPPDVARKGQEGWRGDSGGGGGGGDGGGEVTRSFRNNNPGNIKMSEFAKTHGATGADGQGFAIFPDYNAGRSAQEALWNSSSYANMPLKDALPRWSGGGYTPDKFGLDANTTFAQLTPEQKSAFLDKQQQLEGWSGGGYQPPAVANKADYDYLASTSGHPGRAGDTANLNPTFAGRLTAAIKDARSQGLMVGVGSGFRTPEQTGSEFDAEGRSLHTYGMAADISGLDGPNGDKTKLWNQIAYKYKLFNPYGVGNKAEFNHYQAVNYELKDGSPEQVALNKAYESKNQDAVWKLGNKLMGVTEAPPSPPPPPVVAKQPETAPVPPAKPASLKSPPPPPPPAQPVAKTPAPPDATVGAAQPIQPGIPTSAVASADPSTLPPPPLGMMSDAEMNRPIQSQGYGPDNKWTPNPPLAERPKPVQETPARTTLASNQAPSPQTRDPNAYDPADPSTVPPGMIVNPPDETGGADDDYGVPPSPDMVAALGSGQVMGARRGGAVRRYWRGGVVGYDFGGTVQDPGGSAMGMPPGLAGGGQQQIPPIYFNPATYAPAGAPVGKGISATSAPTMTGGAIPTLPMARGGVVQGFQGGGDVDDIDPIQASNFNAEVEGGRGGAASNPLASMRMIPDDAPAPGEAPTGPPTPAAPESARPIATQADVSAIPDKTAPVSDAETNRPIQLASYGGLPSVRASLGGGPRGPSMRGPSAPRAGTGGGGGRGKQESDFPTIPEDQPYDPSDPTHVNHPDHPANNPNLPKWTPQVMDEHGNPSKGLISAIEDGLHWLGERLGIAPHQTNGAIAGSPDIQAGRRNFVAGNSPDGEPGITPDQHEGIINTIDPNGRLDNNLRNIAGMEAVYEWYRNRGDYDNASKTAAMMLQYSAQMSIKYGDVAVQRYYKGDLQGAIDALTEANNQITDGVLRNAKIIDDPNAPGGKSVEVSGRKLNGEELWRQVVAPQAILGAALQTRNGTMAWNLYEEIAGKYGPGYNEKMEMRRSNQSDQRQADREAAADARLDKRQADIDARAEAKRQQQEADTEKANETKLRILKQMNPDDDTSAPAPVPTPVEGGGGGGGGGGEGAGASIAPAISPTPGAAPAATASAEPEQPSSGMVASAGDTAIPKGPMRVASLNPMSAIAGGASARPSPADSSDGSVVTAKPDSTGTTGQPVPPAGADVGGERPQAIAPKPEMAQVAQAAPAQVAPESKPPVEKAVVAPPEDVSPEETKLTSAHKDAMKALDVQYGYDRAKGVFAGGPKAPLRPESFPDYAGLKRADQLELQVAYQNGIKAVRDYQANMRIAYNKEVDQANRDLTTNIGAAKTRALEREKIAATQQGEAYKEYQKHYGDMDETKLRGIFNSKYVDPETGMAGTDPIDWYANTSAYSVDPNGKPIAPATAKTNIGKDFSIGQLKQMNQALVHVQRANAHESTDVIAEALMGGAKGTLEFRPKPDKDGNDTMIKVEGEPRKLYQFFNVDGQAVAELALPASSANDIMAIRADQYAKAKAAAPKSKPEAIKAAPESRWQRSFEDKPQPVTPPGEPVKPWGGWLLAPRGTPPTAPPPRTAIPHAPEPPGQ